MDERADEPRAPTDAHVATALHRIDSRLAVLESLSQHVGGEIQALLAIRADLLGEVPAPRQGEPDEPPAEDPVTPVALRLAHRAAEDPYWTVACWSDGGPTVSQAVVEILRRRAGAAVRSRDIAQALREQGWVPAETDVDRLTHTTLHRLHHHPTAPVERVRTGYYRFVEP